MNNTDHALPMQLYIGFYNLWVMINKIAKIFLKEITWLKGDREVSFHAYNHKEIIIFISTLALYEYFGLASQEILNLCKLCTST